MTIFVSIASYRDPELLPTLRDCIHKARWPHDLRFGLCWQHDEMESLDTFAEDRRFRIIDIPYLASGGACWARRRCATRYEGESFTMGIDSHHRFVEGWDAELIKMVERVVSNRPVLTTYPPSYDPADETRYEQSPRAMAFGWFDAPGPIVMKGTPIRNFQDLDAPLPSRFFAAGFSFSIGRFAEDVLPDPVMYFRGEETSMCARAFTHGYDLFHPHKIVCWHEYERKGKPKHWSDHVAGPGVTTPWHDLEQRGLARFRRLFGLDPPDPGEDFGPYGFGTARSLREYERYAGVDFALQGVEEYILSDGLPPNPQPYASEADWLKSLLRTYRTEVRLDGRKTAAALDGHDACVLHLCSRNGEIIHTYPFTADQIAQLVTLPHSALTIQYVSRESALSWTVSTMDDCAERALLSGKFDR